MENILNKYVVSYEDFGAIGDGVTDDFLSIKTTHEYANANNVCVKSNPSKTYYIGETFSEIPVMTDTDWSSTKFIIDDSKVPHENAKHAIFSICSKQEKIYFTVSSIQKGQSRLDISLPANAVVLAENEKKKQFIRFGANQNSGHSQTDCFIVDKSGFILTPVIWDFESPTSLTAFPIDERTLHVSGGIFTTIANQAESKYTYYERNIAISRSNVIIDGLVHHVTGELEHGAPYGGFLCVRNSAYVTFQNCHITGHKIYKTIGSAMKPVSMGSYDILLGGSIYVSFLNCKQNDILNISLWGCFGMNNCKNILVDGCTFSRVDSHMNVTNYFIKNSTVGWQGLKAIGHGQMIVENVTIFSYHFIELRADYGSSWDGELLVKNCIWYPLGESKESFPLISSENYGCHDFGYPCSLPGRVTIENVKVMDGLNHEENYEGICVFNANVNKNLTSFDDEVAGDYPYLFARLLNIKGLSSQSGKGYKIWNTIPISCYCHEKHVVKNDKIIANFKAFVDDVEHFTVANSAEVSELFGENHRLLPYIEIKNCDDAEVEPGTYPMVIKKL